MKYKVGDKVRVRQWDDMVKEFGYYNEGKTCINTGNVGFIDVMKKYCGKIVTIAEVDVHCETYIIEGDVWNWSDDMFEPISEQGGNNDK